MTSLYIALCFSERVSAWWPENSLVVKFGMLPENGTDDNSVPANSRKNRLKHNKHCCDSD